MKQRICYISCRNVWLSWALDSSSFKSSVLCSSNPLWPLWFDAAAPRPLPGSRWKWMFGAAPSPPNKSAQNDNDFGYSVASVKNQANDFLTLTPNKATATNGDSVISYIHFSKNDDCIFLVRIATYTEKSTVNTVSHSRSFVIFVCFPARPSSVCNASIENLLRKFDWSIAQLSGYLARKQYSNTHSLAQKLICCLRVRVGEWQFGAVKGETALEAPQIAMLRLEAPGGPSTGRWRCISKTKQNRF